MILISSDLVLASDVLPEAIKALRSIKVVILFHDPHDIIQRYLLTIFEPELQDGIAVLVPIHVSYLASAWLPGGLGNSVRHDVQDDKKEKAKGAAHIYAAAAHAQARLKRVAWQRHHCSAARLACRKIMCSSA